MWARSWREPGTISGSRIGRKRRTGWACSWALCRFCLLRFGARWIAAERKQEEGHPMKATDEEIAAFVEEQWPAFLADAERLIAIDSSLDAEHAAPGAPFGPGPRAALEAALSIAQRMGLDPHDGDGYAGYADLPAKAGSRSASSAMSTLFPLVRAGISPPSPLPAKKGCLLGAEPPTTRLPCSLRCMA